MVRKFSESRLIPIPARVEATAPHAYLRLRRPDYTEAELDARLDALRDLGVNDAFVFFKHEDAGAGPRMAAQFLERAATGP